MNAAGGIPVRLTLWIAAYGTEGYPPRTARRLALINVVAVASAILSLSYVAFYVFYDPAGLWLPITLISLNTALFICTPLLHRFGDMTATFYFLTVWLAGITVLSILNGRDTGVHFYFLPGAAGMLLFLGPHRLRLATALAVIPLALFFFVDYTQLEPVSIIRFDATLIALNYFAAISGSYFLIFIMLLYAFNETRRAEDALEREHERSERLLGNLLPESIALRLKDQPDEIIADDLGEITIAFADIVDFTPRAQRLSPPQLVAFLNRVFTEFDILAEKHGLEKIKTIGDAYMVAAGMPDPRPDHAQAVAEMALDMLEVTTRLSGEIGEEISVRIGLHTGQAVAGVIGTRKFFYDVWGDTVNTASRMESLGEPGRIQVTPEARAALADIYSFEPRGEIEVKGKGLMQTWWLTGRA